ncbi:MAG TPA: class I SAM-dependent methyltransferase [Bacteroidales bacterium]|nr:class I SAM-dependent methyltransferase [Bacteroidales bacterium]HRW94877.1 class I SAM-dependent methyltransferase [Bacteroidales bacterium]
MKTTEESVLAAMDGTDSRILQYLPYILQDFWEIGSDPSVIIGLIKKHLKTPGKPTVLDLGCGKGAVSVKIAKQLGYSCNGIDAIPGFIAFAASKAEDSGVSHLCRFEVGDIREKVKTAGKFHVIILGSIGQVFGDYFETLSLLRNNLTESGILIIDDGYIGDRDGVSQAVHEISRPERTGQTEEQKRVKPGPYLTRNEIVKQIAEAGMQLIEEVVSEGERVTEGENDDSSSDYDTQYAHIVNRCRELSNKYPDKTEMFMEYCKRQRAEYDLLKDRITCATLVIKA